MRFIDDKSLEKLGFMKLLNKIIPLSPYGTQKLKKLKVYSRGEEEELNKEFDKMEEFMRFLEKNSDIVRNVENIIHRMKDIKGILKNSLKGQTLDDVDFFELKIQGMLMQDLNNYIKLFPEKFSEYILYDIEEIVSTLDPDQKRIPSFYIYDSYSEKLKEIRIQKKSIEREIFNTKDIEKKVQLKNKRLDILIEEEQEELKIRQRLTNVILEYSIHYLENIEKIANLDFLIAKVRFAIKYEAIRPSISNEFEIDAYGLVNLEVKEMLEAKGKEFTPIDIKLQSGVTIITGANMGGKSIALKTITENLILFSYGFFVTAKKAKFPIVDFIFFISDDMQDFSKGLSTFGAEIVKLKEVNVFLNLGRGFVVFDEFARGTNPREGQKFVKSLAKYLNLNDSISLITTHFDGVASKDMNHYEVIGLKNVDFNKLKRKIAIEKNSMSLIQDYMDFRLEKTENSEVPKDALNIAKLIGIDEKIANIILQEYSKED